MKMYNTLAKYYDLLVKDEEATKMWTSFFNQHKYKESVLELASGTGEITLELAKNYLVDASDLSKEMLKQLKNKDNNDLIKNYYQLDMRDFALDQTYDNIICFCDSVNYLLKLESLESMFKAVYKHLNKGGVFMFDMHSQDRIEEFQEDYIEAGSILDVAYQWTIIEKEEILYHHFAFYEEDGIKQEFHQQKVFKVDDVIKILEAIGFKLKIFTDFDKPGIQKGEKIFIVGSK